jgi:hypothetical protein
MTTIIIPFPPGGGGNHLKNIIASDISKLNYNNPTVHQTPGHNLQANQVETALANPQATHILHGHFGEIMSYQNQIRNIKDKKFIIICNDNATDHDLLRRRRKQLGYFTFAKGEYFEGEQVFLYEPFMFHHYFDILMENIINIPISEWFVEDITPVINEINYFLKINLDIVVVNKLHKIWYRNNFK